MCSCHFRVCSSVVFSLLLIVSLQSPAISEKCVDDLNTQKKHKSVSHQSYRRVKPGSVPTELSQDRLEDSSRRSQNTFTEQVTRSHEHQSAGHRSVYSTHISAFLLELVSCYLINNKSFFLSFFRDTE